MFFMRFNSNTKLLERNIKLFYIINSLMWMRFFVPVLALFYIASQVPFEQFTIIMSVFSLSIFLLEVPTGVIGDLIGRKNTLLASRFCYIIEIFIIAFFNGFWPFLVAKIISGVGVSLSSGTSQALVYDTLKKLKREDEHKVISGKLYSITNISMAFVFIIGAFLFSINPKLPVYVSLPLISVGFLLTFFLKEPFKSKKRMTFSNSIKHLRESLLCFLKTEQVKYVIFYSMAIAGATSVVLSSSSAFFEKIAVPIYMIGTLAFISSMATALSSKKAHFFEGKLGERKSLVLGQILIVLGLFLISLMINYFGFVFYLIIPVTSGFLNVVLNDHINKHIESSHRATVLSIKGMFEDLSIFILFPILGYLTKYKSMGFSFLILCIIILVYFILLYFYERRLKSKIK